MIEARKASRREIFGWSMFDFANQAYTLLIISVIFGDLYVRIIVGDAPEHRFGNLLWSAALCLSYAVVVITAPLLDTVDRFIKNYPALKAAYGQARRTIDAHPDAPAARVLREMLEEVGEEREALAPAFLPWVKRLRTRIAALTVLPSKNQPR